MVDELSGRASLVEPEKETRFLLATGIDSDEEVIAEVEPIPAAIAASAVV